VKNSKKTILAWCREVTGVKISLLPLRVEASHRVFYRATGSSPVSWVAMSSPPKLENNDQFLALAELFHTNGLGVPQIIHKDLALGYFLMQDLGSTHLEDLYPATPIATALHTNSATHPLAEHAIKSALDTLQQLQPIRSELIPSYDRARMEMEFDLFGEWFVQKLLGVKITNEQLHLLANAKQVLVSAMLEQPQACVHRDYHCRNLLYQNDNSGQQQKIGIVDFQDALIGPALYDPASLLRDCYYTFSEQDIDSMLGHYISTSALFAKYDYDAPEDNAKIKTWFDFTAMQRQIKAVGIFARLHLRDGKSSHLEHIPTVMKRLAVLTNGYSETQDLAHFFQSLDAPMKNYQYLAQV
jgi:aminoglycoside/choline kinase family phosphotransferase